jgi:hypothetical protein
MKKTPARRPVRPARPIAAPQLEAVKGGVKPTTVTASDDWETPVA